MLTLRLISLLGFFAMIVVAWLLSTHRRKINLRILIGGVLLQFALAVMIMKTVPGYWVFSRIGRFFEVALDFVNSGSEMVFGPNYGDFFFAFKVLPTIIFFSSLMAILYHFGLVQKLVKVFAMLMEYTLGTSGAETLSAAANVFVGQTEAPLVVRPYVASMTMSELNAMMVGGFATIAGGVLAAYVGMGIDATHLVTASVISAPAALVIAKVMLPETEKSMTLGTVNVEDDESYVNAVDAAAKGASQGLMLALNVGAMLIAFLALIAMFDYGIAWVGSWFGYMGDDSWSLAILLGYLFYPFAWLMGIEIADCFHAGQLLGMKISVTEFIAYDKLTTWMEPGSGVELSDRTVMIVTYALCGFANFGSIGIQLGGIGGIAPERRGDLAKLGVRAMIGGSLAAFMTACIAGVLN
jgi:CNT family concentrative nucleoside transporter